MTLTHHPALSIIQVKLLLCSYLWLPLKSIWKLRLLSQVTKVVCVEPYVALLPNKPKQWVTCHQPQTLEDAILLMEAYLSAEARI